MAWHYERGVCPDLDAFLARLTKEGFWAGDQRCVLCTCSVTSQCDFSRTRNAGVFCNYYRNGADYAPHHTDSYGADVMSVSLGATRTFAFKEKATNTSVKVTES
jgi:alkylated DNA repair dioxygenase AlkB